MARSNLMRRLGHIDWWIVGSSLCICLLGLVVLYSAGYGNRFGHPAEKVQKRYEQINSQQLSTSDHGMIRVVWETPDANPVIETARQSQIFWWQK